MYNPYSYQYQPQQQVPRVTGENGARAYQIGPNSSILLLDESAPLVWLKMTDSAGYPTLTPYHIEPVKTPDPVNIDALTERIKRLEDMINAKSNDDNARTAERNVQPNGNAQRKS